MNTAAGDPTNPVQAPQAPPVRVIATDAGAIDGANRCVSCGATDVAFDPATAKLRCGYCRTEWLPEGAADAFEIDTDLANLHGTVIGSGSLDIVPSTDAVVTIECQGCGAEIVIDTASLPTARCHWCRNMLTMNRQLPNGAIPDVVLPFTLTREQAMGQIADFVKQRKFFAHRRFRRQFRVENVMGVYLPYLIVDVNARAQLTGQGERRTRIYTRNYPTTKTCYDADVYDVTRTFRLLVDDLTVESSTLRRNRGLHDTNNIINSVMPFDTENAVRYDTNLLVGFTSERRDTNVGDLTPMVSTQLRDIARHSALDTIESYDRGVRWDDEQLTLDGQRWMAAYLPVWLYSHHQKRLGDRDVLHYVAVNGRSGETMGSVPVSQARLVAVSLIVQLIGMFVFLIFAAGSA